MRNRNSSRRSRFGNYEDRTSNDRNLYDSDTRSYGANNVYDTNSRNYNSRERYDNVADRDEYSVGRWSSDNARDREDMRSSRRDFDENIFQRTGKKIRHAWDQMFHDESERYMDDDKDLNDAYDQYETEYSSSGHPYNRIDESQAYGRYGDRNDSRYRNQDPRFTNQYRDRGAFHNDEYDYNTERNRDRYLDDTVNNNYSEHPARYYDDRYVEHNIDRARRALRGERLRRGKTRHAW